jgi:hypothetical protein
MAERDRPHLIVPGPPAAEPFTSTQGGGGGDKRGFNGDRARHGQTLVRQLREAVRAPDETDTAGTYVSFESFPGLELALNSLDVQRAGEQPELVAVKEVSTGPGAVQIATVYIPDGKRDYFLKRLNAYVATATDDKASNAALVEGIAAIRRATIRELWTDPDDEFPADAGEVRWWEVWLRRHDGHEQERLAQFADQNQLLTSGHYLGFQDRTIMLVRATADQLAQGLDSLDDLAELRRPHEVASLLTDMPAAEQADWAEELRGRLQVAGPESPVVCVLDTGVHDGHPLLADSLAEADVHVADARWRERPVIHPHGTEMAGLALYGDLHRVVTAAQPVLLDHRLESVKILPDYGQNERDLYGAITARAVDRPEIAAPERSRVFMLAVTAPNTEADESEFAADAKRGRPTSWSAAIDALTFGRAIDDTDAKLTYLDRDEPPIPRLFVISAGNIQAINPADDHLDRSDLSPVEDPAQSWNSLTVGAYSRHDDMADAPAAFAGYVPIAARGELSPVSRTSVLHGGDWPFKPEVVADGGNIAASPDNTTADTPPNLGVLTTRLGQLGSGFFTTTGATSAATAQVAAIAASIRAGYPDLRPETVRALIVHSAQWTPAMRAHFQARGASKADLANRLRRYGMGVPDLDRAVRSATDALTLVAEAAIHPFERGEGAGKVREMNLHELPWPAEELESLAETEVSLRVTLSYFIEPNPSSRGWTGRYVYPSHGLRFATKRADESLDKFRRRINKRAREGQRLDSPKTEKGWLFGSAQQQKPGSLHTDIWKGPAVDLASKGAIAVYPVAGWWQYRRAWDQSDRGVAYSLVVSVEAPEVDIDLWTPVYQQIQPTIEITA